MTKNIHSNNLIRILSIFLTPFIISYLSIFLLTESLELTLFHLGAFPVFSTLTVFLIFQYFFVYIQDERMHKLYFKSSIFIAFTFILFFLFGKEFFLLFSGSYFLIIFLYSYFKKKKLISTYFLPTIISFIPVLYIVVLESIHDSSENQFPRMHFSKDFIYIIYFNLMFLLLFFIFIFIYNLFLKKLNIQYLKINQKTSFFINTMFFVAILLSFNLFLNYGVSVLMTTSTSLSSSTYLPFLEIERTELLFSAFLFFTIIMTAITFLTFVRNKDNILLKMILFILLSGFINLLLKNFNIDFTEIDSLILEQMPITLALWIAFLLWNLKSNRILKTIGYTFIFIFFNYSLMHFSTLGVYSGLSKENQEIIESNDLFHGNAVMSLCQDNGKEIVYKWMVIPFERDCHHTIFLEEKEALTNEKQIYIDSLKSPAYPTVVSGLYNYRHKISKISKQQITEFYLLQYRTLKRHSDYYDEFESLRKNNAFKKFYKNMEPSVQILEKNPEKTIFDIKENELEETQTVFLLVHFL